MQGNVVIYDTHKKVLFNNEENNSHDPMQPASVFCFDWEIYQNGRHFIFLWLFCQKKLWKHC